MANKPEKLQQKSLTVPQGENRRTSHGRDGGKLRKDNCETKCQSQSQTATQTLMKFRSNFVGEQRERQSVCGGERGRESRSLWLSK